jgi:uncharacterized protein (TIGR03067 family)
MARVLTLAAAVLLATSVAGRIDQDKEKDSPDSELKLLQGTWRIVYHETAGVEDSQEIIWELEVKGDSFTLRADSTITHGTIKLDPSKNPKQLEYTLDYYDESLTFTGIYQLMGDTYRTCDVEKDKAPRPGEFKTKEKTGQVAIWKKVKVRD